METNFTMQDRIFLFPTIFPMQVLGKRSLLIANYHASRRFYNFFPDLQDMQTK